MEEEGLAAAYDGGKAKGDSPPVCLGKSHKSYAKPGPFPQKQGNKVAKENSYLHCAAATLQPATRHSSYLQKLNTSRDREGERRELMLVIR